MPSSSSPSVSSRRCLCKTTAKAQLKTLALVFAVAASSVNAADFNCQFSANGKNFDLTAVNATKS